MFYLQVPCQLFNASRCGVMKRNATGLGQTAARPIDLLQFCIEERQSIEAPAEAESLAPVGSVNHGPHLNTFVH
jgi:hypothetical protein